MGELCFFSFQKMKRGARLWYILIKLKCQDCFIYNGLCINAPMVRNLLTEISLRALPTADIWKRKTKIQNILQGRLNILIGGRVQLKLITTLPHWYLQYPCPVHKHQQFCQLNEFPAISRSSHLNFKFHPLKIKIKIWDLGNILKVWSWGRIICSLQAFFPNLVILAW